MAKEDQIIRRMQAVHALRWQGIYAGVILFMGVILFFVVMILLWMGKFRESVAAAGLMTAFGWKAVVNCFFPPTTYRLKVGSEVGSAEQS